MGSIPQTLYPELKSTADTSEVNQSQHQNTYLTIASFAKWSPSNVNLVDQNTSCESVVKSNLSIIDHQISRSSWKCFQCGISKESREGLVLHLRMKHRILKCSFCDYFTCRIENFSTLRNHQKKHASALKLQQKEITSTKKRRNCNAKDLCTSVSASHAVDHRRDISETLDKECVEEEMVGGPIREAGAERIKVIINMKQTNSS